MKSIANFTTERKPRIEIQLLGHTAWLSAGGDVLYFTGPAKGLAWVLAIYLAAVAHVAAFSLPDEKYGCR